MGDSVRYIVGPEQCYVLFRIWNLDDQVGAHSAAVGTYPMGGVTSLRVAHHSKGVDGNTPQENQHGRGVPRTGTEGL